VQYVRERRERGGREGERRERGGREEGERRERAGREQGKRREEREEESSEAVWRMRNSLLLPNLN
jgi:hypothetical protein